MVTSLVEAEFCQYCRGSGSTHSECKKSVENYVQPLIVSDLMLIDMIEEEGTIQITIQDLCAGECCGNEEPICVDFVIGLRQLIKELSKREGMELSLADWDCDNEDLRQYTIDLDINLNEIERGFGIMSNLIVENAFPECKGCPFCLECYGEKAIFCYCPFNGKFLDVKIIESEKIIEKIGFQAE